MTDIEHAAYDDLDCQEWTEDILMAILPVLEFDDMTVQDDGLDDLRCEIRDISGRFAA